MGIEPTTPGWKPGILPVNYRRIEEKIPSKDDEQNRTRTYSRQMSTDLQSAPDPPRVSAQKIFWICSFLISFKYYSYYKNKKAKSKK